MKAWRMTSAATPMAIPAMESRPTILTTLEFDGLHTRLAAMLQTALRSVSPF
jgi:hypothetical protein